MATTPPPVGLEPQRPAHAPVGRIIMIVIGALLLLLTLVVGGIGTALTWAHATDRDADGFFTTDDVRIETITNAIVSSDIDLGASPGGEDRRFDLGDLATLRLTVDSNREAPVFVGIGSEDEVDRYLDGVPRARIVDVDPIELDFTDASGTAPGRPGDQDFWAASVEGSGVQTLEWELEEGNWTAVVMNADGSAGVAVDASAGVKADWLLPVGVGLLVGALVLAIIGTVLLVLGATGLGRHIGATQPAAPVPAIDGVTASPVSLRGRIDVPLNRWLWLVKWLLLLPHFVVLAVLWLAFGVVTLIAGVAILFTGRYPASLFEFNAGVLRWTWRVVFYGIGGLATDRYPPFSLRDDPTYPAGLDIEPPGQLSRGLVLVKWWLLAIPHYVVVGLLVGGGIGVEIGDAETGPGLILWLVVVAGVILLFTGRYPKGLFDFVMGLQRWVYRTIAYAALMTDRYPPFRLDQGPEEPAPTPTTGTDAVVDAAPPG